MINQNPVHREKENTCMHNTYASIFSLFEPSINKELFFGLYLFQTNQYIKLNWAALQEY